MKILIADSYYPEVIKRLPVDPSVDYQANLQRIMEFSFGTFDAYSRNLRAIGWECADVIVNHDQLQELWANETGWYAGNRLESQIAQFQPDVVFMQDLSVPVIRNDWILAGQLSCPWPGDGIVSRFDLLFTSFPHYVPRIEALGVRAVYNPLAFEPSVLERIANMRTREVFGLSDDAELLDVSPEFGPIKPRIHDVVFIGGVGNPSHWRYGMEVLETVAREIPTFKWWGYGYDTLPADSALRRCYQGEAWGLQMYEILLQSKICLNRHGEVAEGYANNMRMFEATGCGALLLTEDATNLSSLFGEDDCVPYKSADDAVSQILHYLDHGGNLQYVAWMGQQTTLTYHTYAQRMKTVSETLKGMLCPA